MSKGWLAVRKVGTPPTADWAFYCGRNFDRWGAGLINADLGNPYVVNEHQARGEAIERFKAEFNAQESPRSREWQAAVDWLEGVISTGQSVELFCHCNPKPCHCDSIKQAVDFQVATRPRF